MFNLLISHDPESWASSPFELDRRRVAIEYTADEISERYKFLDDKAIVIPPFLTARMSRG